MRRPLTVFDVIILTARRSFIVEDSPCDLLAALDRALFDVRAKGARP